MEILNKSFFTAKHKQSMTVDTLLENLSKNHNFYHHLKYISNHATELLEIALNENDVLKSSENSKSRIALLLLSNSPKIVMDQLLIDGRFLIKSTKILGCSNLNLSFNIEKELASRLALIFINIITKTNDKDFIIDSVGFLTQMTRFIEDYSVFNFFRLVVSINDDFKEMQYYFSQVNFYKFLLNELSNESETNLIKENNICVFIKDCLQNPIIHNSFQKEEILIKLIEMLEKRKEFILNSQTQQINFGDDKIRLINKIYETLSLMVCQNLVIKMKPILTLSIEIIKKNSDSIKLLINSKSSSIDYYSHLIIRKYHVCIFDLLSKVIKLKSNIINSNEQIILINSVKEIIQVFPNSTNLVTAAFRLVKSSLYCNNFAQKMVHSLMPLMISLAKSKSRTASAAASTHFLADMEATKYYCQMINDFLTKSDQYMSFYNTYFKNYLETAYVPYGGPVTVFNNKNVKIIRVKKSDFIGRSTNSFAT